MGDAFGNLLLSAMRYLPGEAVIYKKFISRSSNEQGIFQNVYANPKVIYGCSIQPIPVTKKILRGMDISRDAVAAFVPSSVKWVRDAKSTDIFEFRNANWTLFGEADWADYDGWTEITLLRDQEGVTNGL